MIIRKNVSWTLKFLALVWILLLSICLSLQIRHFVQHSIQYDLISTEANVEYDSVVELATERLSYLGDYRAIFMVGFPAESSSDFESYVARINAGWNPPKALKQIQWEALDINDTLSYYRTISKSLMSMRDQLDATTATDDELFAKAIESLTTVGNNGYIAKIEDPLGFFARWVQKRVPKSTILTTGETLKLYADSYVWAISFYQTTKDLDGLNPIGLTRSVEQLKDVVHEIDPNARVLVRGMPYESAVVATKNLKDLAAIVGALICFFGFLAYRWTRSNTLPGLMLGCTVAGLIGGLTALLTIFSAINLWALTLGVCFISISFMNSAYVSFIHHRHPNMDAKACLKEALPVMLWITAVECIAFGVLWCIPIPVWQNVAVFMCSAILTSQITLVIAYLIINTKDDRQDINPEKFEQFNRYWPRLSLKRWQKAPYDTVGYVVISLFIISCGFYLLEFDLENDSFVKVPLQVQLDSERVEDMLMLPSSDQFFLVTSASEQETLMNEEALRMGFAQRRFSNMTTTCVTKWLPSYERADRVKKIRSELFERIKDRINPLIHHKIKPNMNNQPTIQFDSWYSSASSIPVRHLWLGEHDGRISSIVQIAGITEPFVPQLKKLSDALSGVVFIDTIQKAKQRLNENRFFMSGIYVLLVISSIALSLFHYGLNSWRIVFPPLVGSLVTVACLGWLKIPFSLVSVAALIIVYGVGMAMSLCYQNNRSYGGKNLILLFYSLVAILANFGILSLVEAPFTHEFSLTCMIGIFLTFCFAILFRISSNQKH